MAGGGKGGGQTQSVGLDKNTQRFVEQELRPGATQAADYARTGAGQLFGGATPEQQQAMGNVGGLQQDQLQQLFGGAGQAMSNLGFGGQQGLGGIEGFTNPFEQQVVQGMQADINHQAQLADQSAAQRATMSGAFGGSRSDLSRALGESGVRAQGARQIGQFRNQNFANAQQGLLQQQQMAANLGLGGLQAFGQGLGIGGGLAGQQFGMGDAMRQIGNQQNQEGLFRHQQALGFLGQGIGPHGQVSHQEGPGRTAGSVIGSTAGGAMAGSAFGPPGAIIGGGIGLLGGLFG